MALMAVSGLTAFKKKILFLRGRGYIKCIHYFNF